MTANVSIVVPSLYSPGVADTVRSLLSQSARTAIREIFVVGRGAEGVASSDGCVRFLDTCRPVTAPVARNLGILESTGEILAFIDADCVADRRWLERLLSALRLGANVVGGGVAFPARPYWQLCYNVAMFHDFHVTSRPGTRPNLGTLNLCCAREVVERVGLMDERLDRGQDTEWSLRMRRHGYNLQFAPDAVVTHLPSVCSLRALVRRWYVSGKYNSWVRRQYSDLATAPPLDGCPVIQCAATPVVSFVVSLRLFARNPRLLQYVHTFPAVVATRAAWWWGASRHFDPTQAPP